MHIQQEAQINSLKVGIFAKEEGPCVRVIEKVLNEIGVDRQAYYSGTFVGNHVHKCLKVNYCKETCNNFQDLSS